GSPDPVAPDVTDARPPDHVAPVMKDVHVIDVVMPEVVMPEGEAELEASEGFDAEAEVERAPAPGDRPRIPVGPHPIRIVVAGAVDHDGARRHHRPQIA